MECPGLGEAEYLCYRMVRELQDRGHEVSQSKFYKTTLLAYQNLKEQGIDPELPHFWFMYGDVIDTEEINSGFYRKESRSWGQYRGEAIVIDDSVSDEDFATDGGTREAIIEQTTEIADQYSDQYRVGPLRDETYEIFDTTEFVVQFNVFRNQLDEMDTSGFSSDQDVPGVSVSISDLSEEEGSSEAQELPEEDLSELRGLLDALVEKYPQDEYSYAEHQFRKWESLSRHLLRENMISVFEQFADQFWRMFSLVELRINHNENISPLKVQRWRRERDNIVSGFEETTEERREQILGNREPTNQRQVVGNSFSQAVRDVYWDKKNEMYSE